jgi:putative lipoprotein
MTFKKIYGIILGAVVAGLTSCSSELSSEGNATVNPNQTARRALTIAVGDGGTRSVVSLETNGNKWENGDLFGAANMTTPGNLEKLTAKGSGASTKLEGNIDCANGDKIGVFFPYKLSTGQDQKLVEISMNNGIVSTNGKPAEYKQNGTIENLKYFDYSFGTTNVQVNADGSAKATGSVNMEKQYAVLGLKFTVTKNSTTSDITENVKKVTMSNVADEAVFKMVTGTLENKSELGTINIETSNLNRIYVAVFPDDNFSPKFTVETNDNKTYTVSVSGKKVEAAAYYPITVEVKEYIPNPPYIEIAGVKWGKSNLQYTPGSNADGWTGGYHLAANPWDYYYLDGSLPALSTGSAAETDAIKFDHFRWGDISKAHNYGYDAKMHYDETVGDIKGQITTPNEFGDLPYYASQHNWRLPSPEDFEELMKNTTEYVGYYKDGTNTIYGVLFVPDGVAHGWVVNKNNSKYKQSNQTGSIPKNQWREFTKEFINKGVFFPAAGSYVDYSNNAPTMYTAGRQGLYWTSKSESATNAYSFTFYLINNDFNLPTVGNSNAGNRPRKFEMYSIRPIYIGD